MSVTGRVSEVMPEHSTKALYPMVVTGLPPMLEGMETDAEGEGLVPESMRMVVPKSV